MKPYAASDMDAGMSQTGGADAIQANLIRQANLDRLRLAMRVLQTATRPQLARQTGLSVVTVNALAEVLAAAGEIFIDDDRALATGGRPAQRYRYNARFRLALAIHTGEAEHRDAIRAEVIDLLGAVVDYGETIQESISEDALERMISDMLARHPAIRAIGIGLPGLERGGRLDVDYQALAGKGLVRHLQERFQMPVVFENDANAAILGFCSGSPCQGRTVVGIYLPEKYPPGAGICIDGCIHRGRSGFAGEVKHLPWARTPDLLLPGSGNGSAAVSGAGSTEGPAARPKAGPTDSSGAIKAALVNLVITFTCVLNPDTIVLYRRSLSGQTVEAVRETCRQSVPAEFLPEILASDSFQADFSRGIREIALKALDPQTKASV